MVIEVWWISILGEGGINTACTEFVFVVIEVWWFSISIFEEGG